ncbi:MAG: YdcF family protein [Lachnospiraceae bacterium]|nr:YdcF family protein [Lachnospiraceae bacterium]
MKKGSGNMKKRLIILVAACLAAIAVVVLLLVHPWSQKTPVSKANAENYGVLLIDFVNAVETPSGQDAQKIEEDLTAIKTADPKDYDMAKSIADHWMKVYVDPDYQIYLYHGGDTAPELENAGIEDSGKHAIVILGYALKDGEMQPELMGRCDAAAAMARTFPNTILVCSGGATGDNNPEKHTEAGMMKEYLVEHCGIDAGRIFIDENAMTTADNASNTLKILRKKGIRTMTIVTSSYHQRRGQMLYHVMAQRYKKQYGYSVEIVGNYNYDTETSSPIEVVNQRVAVSQIAELLELPDEVKQALPPFR